MFNVNTVVDEQILQKIPKPILDQKEFSHQDAVPTISEVVKAIQQIKNRRAPGKDEISAELIKAGGLPLAEWLHEIIRDVWEQEIMVKDWTVAVLIRLYKNKGDKRICDNYRGISLLIELYSKHARQKIARGTGRLPLWQIYKRSSIHIENDYGKIKRIQSTTAHMFDRSTEGVRFG
ncbi:unnamed protein product [Rotaria sp. Silwood2]|nr:unnamed protein product [Rotaria sp. Silwood2]